MSRGNSYELSLTWNNNQEWMWRPILMKGPHVRWVRWGRGILNIGRWSQ